MRRNIVVSLVLFGLLAVQGEAVNYRDATRIRISHDYNLLKKPYRPAGQDPFERILVRGNVGGDTSYYIEPLALTEADKKVRGTIKWFRVTYLTISGTDENPIIGDSIVWTGTVSYASDGTPTVHDPDGPPGGGGPDPAIFLVDYWIIREIMQTITCGAINFWVGLPVCINIPGKFDKPEKEELTAEKIQTKPFRGWLELLPNSHDLCEITWEVLVEYRANGLPTETQFNSGHFDFDFDKDGFTNRHEIETGHSPYDPTDNPGGPTMVEVPNVLGLSLEIAENNLETVDLRVGNVSYVYNQATAGIVIGQTPAAGTTVLSGSDVNLTVSLGPQSQSLLATIVSPMANAVMSVGQTILFTSCVSGGQGPYNRHWLLPDGTIIDDDTALVGNSAVEHIFTLPNIPNSYSVGTAYLQVTDANGVQYPPAGQSPLMVTITVLGPAS